MIQLEPADSPGCFKMFNTTGGQRESPGRIFKPAQYRAIPGQRRSNAGISGAGPVLNRRSTVINPSKPGLLGSTQCKVELRLNTGMYREYENALTFLY